MTENILDNGFENPKKRYSFTNWIAIVILWIGILYSISQGLVSNIQISAALIFLSVTTIISYFNFQLGIKITFFVILAGILGFIEFFPFNYKIGFDIGDFFLGVNILLFIIGLLHFYTNKEEMFDFLLKEVEVSEDRQKSSNRSSVNGFKRRFADREIDELKTIVSNKKLLPSAIQAAEELLKEKQQST